MDGKQTFVAFKDAGTIEFDDNSVKIAQYIFHLDEVVKYNFGDLSQGGVNEINADLNGWEIDRNGILKAPYLLDDMMVKVISIDGKEMPVLVQGNIIDITALTTAVYIIQVGTQSFKFAKI